MASLWDRIYAQVKTGDKANFMDPYADYTMFDNRLATTYGGADYNGKKPMTQEEAIKYTENAVNAGAFNPGTGNFGADSYVGPTWNYSRSNLDADGNLKEGANVPTGPGTGGVGGAVAGASGADAARAQQLRGDITSLVNNVKDLFNQRYGKVDASAKEQGQKLNNRYIQESSNLAEQVTSENEKVGAAHASRGTYNSSYRGNDVDTVTEAGDRQIRSLGQELEDNIAKIASWVAEQKGTFDAEIKGQNRIADRLDEVQDVNELQSLRSKIESKITELEGGTPKYNTEAENAKSLQGILTNGDGRGLRLQTTLSQILAGNAGKKQKQALGSRLIQSSNLSEEEKQKLLSGFQAELGSEEEKKEAKTV